MILGAISPFFSQLLKRNQHTHPLIYMRGIKSEDLGAIIDFLYCGEANICQENLDSFLAIASELKLKGLMGETDARESQAQDLYANQNPMKTELKPDKRQPAQQLMNADTRVAISKHLSGDFQELNDQVKSLMESSQNSIQNGRMSRTRAKYAKCVEKKEPQVPLEITLKTTIWKEFHFPVMPVKRLSGQEQH